MSRVLPNDSNPAEPSGEACSPHTYRVTFTIPPAAVHQPVANRAHLLRMTAAAPGLQAFRYTWASDQPGVTSLQFGGGGITAMAGRAWDRGHEVSVRPRHRVAMTMEAALVARPGQTRNPEQDCSDEE